MKGTYVRSSTDEEQANVTELLSSYISIQKCNLLRDVYASGCVVHIIAATGDIDTYK
jgi:hypothetical protein